MKHSRPDILRPSDRKKIAACAVLIFFATFAVYLSSLKNDFVWDDNYLIVNNAQIKNLSRLPDIFRTYLGYGSDNINNFYRPVQELSNMIDYSLWGNRPFGFHLTNTLLHSVNAVLVFALLLALSGNLSISLLSGILFGVHAINTEAVSYIAGRADPLYSFFFISSLLLFIRYCGNYSASHKRDPFLVYSLIAFAIAVLSKEIALIMPAVIFLYVRLIPDKNARAAVKNLWIPYAVLVLIYAALRATLLNFPSSPLNGIEKIPLVNRLLAFSKTVPVYLKLLVFPSGLHMERTIGVPRTVFEAEALLSFCMMSALIFYGTIILRKNRLTAFFIFWFLVNLLPVANILPINSFIAEHWVYMASISYFFAVSSLLCLLYAKIGRTTLGKISVYVMAIIIISFYSFQTIQRNKTWKNSVSFFEDTLKYSPGNGRLYLSLGNTYFQKGDLDKAIEKYGKALTIKNDYEMAYSNMGAAYLYKGNLPEAEKLLRKAVELKYNFPFAHYALGLLYGRQKKTDEAIEEIRIAITQRPQYQNALNTLGDLYMAKGEMENAAKAFSKSLEVMPDQNNIRATLKRIKSD